MTMEIRTIDDIAESLKIEQMARHPYLKDYTDYSVLTTLNQSMGVQVQYVEEQSKAEIEANSIWTATGDDLDLLVSDRGISRQEGIRATGTITFRTSSPATVAIDIPMGTLTSSTGSDGTVIFFETTVAGTIDVGYTSATIYAQAQETGEDGNVPEYSINTLKVYISGITRVENTSAFSGGTNEESDDDLRTRYKYATDINGKATLPLMEQHIYDLETVRECQIYTKSAGEIEIVVDTSVIADDDDDVVDCIEENIAVGIVGRGCVLATIDNGIITPSIDTIKSGKLYVRVESNLISVGESFLLNYKNTSGISRTASVVIPNGATKGDVVMATMYSTSDLATEVDGYTYAGSNSYTILGGYGTYPYLYVIPTIVLVNVQIGITQTSTPDPDLESKVEESVNAYLDEFYIGDDIEFSDLIPYIYMDYATKDTTRDQFVGIENISSVIITAKGLSINGFGQTITIDDDERVEPGTINVTLI